MQLKRTARFAVVAFLCASIVACGGDSIILNPGTEPPTVIIITPTAPTVAEGGKLKLNVAVSVGNTQVVNPKVTWTSTNTATATVSDSGEVTGVAVGTTTIVAAAVTGQLASVTLTVKVDPCKVSQSVPIQPGVNVNGTLSATDCDLGDGTYLDAYSFSLESSTNVEILMISGAFDAFIYLFNSTPAGVQERARDDDSGGGTDARLFGTLTAGTYYILANSTNINGFGAYSLLLTSPFAGLNARSSLFADAPEPTALRRLSVAEARTFRVLARKTQ